MKKINPGRLRAIGYDARARMLQVQLDDGGTLQYDGIGEDTLRRLSSSGAGWSYYCDNIEDVRCDARFQRCTCCPEPARRVVPETLKPIYSLDLPRR